MKRVLCILVFAALFLGCLVPLCVWGETPEQTIAVRIGRNVDAYRRATPKSVFVGWAQAGGHYTVLETVRGYEDCEWIRIRLENGADVCSDVLRQLVMKGVPVIDFHRAPMNLEKVFMEVTQDA